MILIVVTSGAFIPYLHSCGKLNKNGMGLIKKEKRALAEFGRETDVRDVQS